jgi:hypothetical protein
VAPDQARAGLGCLEAADRAVAAVPEAPVDLADQVDPAGDRAAPAADQADHGSCRDNKKEAHLSVRLFL